MASPSNHKRIATARKIRGFLEILVQCQLADKIHISTSPDGQVLLSVCPPARSD